MCETRLKEIDMSIFENCRITPYMKFWHYKPRNTGQFGDSIMRKNAYGLMSFA